METIPYHCDKSGRCCVNNIVPLTPFDIFRIANALGKSAKELFEKRIFAYKIQGSTYWMEPVIQLKTNLACQFLTRANPESEELICSIYEDRPYTCRIFPLKYDPDHKNYLRGTNGEKRCIGCVDETKPISLVEYLKNANIGTMAEEFTDYRNLVEQLSLLGYNLKELKNKKEKQKIFFSVQALLYETYPNQEGQESFPWTTVKETILNMVI